MELKIYLNILLKKWWIVIPVFLITLTSGMIFTYTQTPVYKASTSYVVVPSASFSSGREFASGLDMLGRREEIATTFAEIATSRAVRNLALQSLSVDEASGYSIDSNIRADTNILAVAVEGPDPTITSDLANAVGKTVEEYVKGLYEVFTLVPLDQATPPRWPTSPNRSLNITLAAIFGLILGASVAFLSEYLEAPLSSAVSVNIIDDETGLYNKEYFSGRLSKEMVRAKRNKYPLSIALMRIENLTMLKGENSATVRTEILRQVGMFANQYLREEDIVAYLENDIFALLLPDMTGENAKTLIEYLQTRIAWTPFKTSTGTTFNLASVVGITAYDHNGTSRDELLLQAQKALGLAEVSDNGKTYLITDHLPGNNNA